MFEWELCLIIIKYFHFLSHLIINEQKSGWNIYPDNCPVETDGAGVYTPTLKASKEGCGGAVDLT